MPAHAVRLDSSSEVMPMNGADTAWMLIATALVLMMTPALGFFYGGLVREKNALNTLMMSFTAGIAGIFGAFILIIGIFLLRDWLWPLPPLPVKD